MKTNQMLRQVKACMLIFATVLSIMPLSASTAYAAEADFASGIEGAKGSVSIHGKDTMHDYIQSNYTYTDQMTVSDYKTERSASYDRNDVATGKNSTDYLDQAVEWTDVNNGKALLTVAGKDTTDSVALYVFTTCLSDPNFTATDVRDNILDLLRVYDRVDVICDETYFAWCPWDEATDSYGSSGSMDALAMVDSNFNSYYWGETYHGNMCAYGYSSGTKNGSLYPLTTANGYGGISPYVSFYSDDFSSDKAVSDAVFRYLQGVQWSGNHPSDALIPCVKAYMCGDFSYEKWNTAQITSYDYGSSTCVANMKENMENGNGVAESDLRPRQYGKELYRVLDTPFKDSKVVNSPTAIYYCASHDGAGALQDPEMTYASCDKSFLKYLADNYQSNGISWVNMGSGGPAGISGVAVNTYTKGAACTRANAYGNDMAYTYDTSDIPESGSFKWLSLCSAYNPKYVLANYISILGGGFGPSEAQLRPDKSQGRYRYIGGQSFSEQGVVMPNKQLSFDIPIGDSWQIDSGPLPDPNIIYTYKNKAGNYVTTDVSGRLLKATLSASSDHVLHINTNTYVKGAEISIQIPLKYSANGVQSAKQLRVGDDGKVYTDGSSGKAVDDTYIISMTSGDTQLHVGPDILGDLDTSLSIYMPSSTLMDVKVNLHWQNDSEAIKSALGNTSTRGNATALIGSEALAGKQLGRQSDDDEKAGGSGTSVVALNYADANGKINVTNSSYTDSDGVVKRVANDGVDVELASKDGQPALWTDEDDNAGMGNVVSYMVYNVPRFGHPVANTYDKDGNITAVKDLANGIVPRYYYVEDVVNVPKGYTAYNVTDVSMDDITKMQKSVGTDSENPMTYKQPLYYAYVITPPADWNMNSKAVYQIDCYVSLDIKSVKMTVEHYQEQLSGDGYAPVKDKQYKLVGTSSSYVGISSAYSPDVNTYAGYDSPDKQSVIANVGKQQVVKYYYDLHYYDINVNTAGGEWYAKNDDGAYVKTTQPPVSYTVLTPTFTLQVPDKTGFDFAGYTGTDLTGSVKAVSIKTGSTGNKSYLAGWTAQAYDVNVPVSIIFSAGYDGTMHGSFDQTGTGKLTDTGYLLNNSNFPVQVTGIKYVNNSDYKVSSDKTDAENIMNWRLDAANGSNVRNDWATVLTDGVNTSADAAYYMPVSGKIVLDADQAWMKHDTKYIKTKTNIGNIVWTFDLGHRNVVNK